MLPIVSSALSCLPRPASSLSQIASCSQAVCHASHRWGVCSQLFPEGGYEGNFSATGPAGGPFKNVIRICVFLAGILGVIAGWILRETAPPLTTHECQGLLYADTILGIAASGIAFAADTVFSLYLVLRFVVLKVVLTCCGDGVFPVRQDFPPGHPLPFIWIRCRRVHLCCRRVFRLWAWRQRCYS